MTTARRFGLLLLAAWSAIVLGAPSPSRPPQGVDPRADKVLREMSDYLGRQKELCPRSTGVVDVVTKDGQKLDIPFSSQVWVKRPNKLRADRVKEATSRSFFYDGTSFTMYGRKANLYAQTPAPPTLDQAIDSARNDLGIEAPAADLLYANAYAGLMDGVTSGLYVGEEMIDGVPVHHLAFRGQDVDWQMWIETGPRPVPRRYVITSKDIKGAPEFRADLSEWSCPSPLADSQFTFRPPEGAQRIEFLKPGQTEATGGAGQEHAP